MTPSSVTPSAALKPARAARRAPAQRAKTAENKAAVKKAPAAPKAAAPAAAKDAKAKKPKLVRDSYTIPKDEYTIVETLKQRASALAQPVKKSELLRAGLKALAGMSDNALGGALRAVPSIKTGRPRADAAETAPAARTKAGAARK
ncbi:hypothetical protein [Verminephrobacter aporrectodeae]|uniref:hypothetical protein n=1 Tax=Verminephrobacter aporrectodeae TaxID=1110389 RepID=UPI002244F3A9|nr:hypothetical protein [Verminephrobacter aporrectodeae]